MVTIPNGDYKLQKTITGRIAADDTTPFVYTSPLDNMIKITNNIFDSDDAIKNKGSLLANDKGDNPAVLGTTTSALYSLSSTTGEFSGFTRLGVSADFKSWLADLGAVSGTYGIAIIVYFHDLSAPGEPGKPNSRTYVLDTNDMIGNPYYFDSYFTQEKVFDISDINNIEEIDVRFFQNGDFKDKEGKLIPYEIINDITGETEKLEHNIFVDNVSIMLGYEMDAFEGETLLLSTPDGLSYHYNDPNFNKKAINLRWIHKIDDTHYSMLDGMNMPLSCSVRWFKHHPGYTPPEGQTLDEFAGKDWEPIKKNYSLNAPRESGYDTYNRCKLHFIPNTNKQNELIKAIGIITTKTNEPTGEFDEAGNEKIEEREQVVHYVCKENLTLTNEEYVPDQISVEAATALQIVCEDGSEGNYFLYNQNGKINNEGEGQGKKRTLKAMYQGLELTPALGKLDFIEWWMPTDFTMLNVPNEYYIENKGVRADDLHYNSVSYSSSTRKTNAEKKLTSTQMSYSISNQWGHQKANNTVRCRASINGVVYEATAELRFGKAGTNGTNQTFLIEFEDNQNGLVINRYPYAEQLEAQRIADQELQKAINEGANQETISALQSAYDSAKLRDINVIARLYDGNGSRVDFTTDQAQNIQWAWFKESLNDQDQPKQYITFADTKSGSKKRLICNINEIPKDNYYILQATYGQLVAYLPIPLKTRKASFIEGAREVIYDHQGNPQYYSDPYMLYYVGDDNTYKASEPRNTHWELQFSENNAQTATDLTPKARQSNTRLLNSYLPSLKIISGKGEGYVGLSASPMYASGFNDKVCVSTWDTSTALGWSQPILIMQSRYDFAMLNEWDGSLQMDEETGSVMATMLGAGRKNADNTFSGVLIGDVGKGTKKEDTTTLTGVYGLHRGEFSFALKEDGTAFFGKDGRGQIKIDGNDGTIKSAIYDDGEGMLIDMDDGVIDILGPKIDHYTVVLANDRTQADLDAGLYYQEYDGQYYPIQGNIEDYVNSVIYINNITQAGVYISPNGSTGNNFYFNNRPTNSYFNIRSNNGNSLIDIANDNYYLCSDNWNGEMGNSGTFLSLNDGVLDIRSPIGQVYISGGYSPGGDTPNENPYFSIGVPRNGDLEHSYGKKLFLVSESEYYLESKDYDTSRIKQATDSDGVEYNTYWGTESVTGTQDVENGTSQDSNQIPEDEIETDDTNTKKVLVAIKNNKIYDVNNDFSIGDDPKQFNPITYEKSNNSGGKTRVTISAEDVEKAFRLTLTPNFDENKDTKGFRLDLKNSKIEGYKLLIRGLSEDGDKDKNFVFDSGADSNPITVGTNFKIDWDGTLTCNKINSINNDGNNEKVISVANNFYVSKSGGAGGSGCSFGGSFGGFFSGKAAASTLIGDTGYTLQQLVEYVIALRGHTHSFTVPALEHEYKTSTKASQKTSTDEGHSHQMAEIWTHNAVKDQVTSSPTLGYVSEDWSDANGPALPEAPPPTE